MYEMCSNLLFSVFEHIFNDRLCEPDAILLGNGESEYE